MSWSRILIKLYIFTAPCYVYMEQKQLDTSWVGDLQASVTKEKEIKGDKVSCSGIIKLTNHGIYNK